MSKKKLSYIAVSPEFKKKLMYESKVVRGITMAEYTRKLGESERSIKEELEDSKKKVRKGWNFGI